MQRKGVTMTKAELTKQMILEKAAIVYNEKGINGSSIDDVLAAAKVTKGCLYSHFENKEDLSVQTADYLLNKIVYGIGQVMLKEKTVKGKIFAFLDFYKYPLNSYIQGGCPIINLATEVDDNHKTIKKKVQKTITQANEAFARILQEGIINKELSEELEAEVFAFKIFAALEGAMVTCRAMNTNAPMQGLIRSLKAEFETYTLN